MLKLSRPEPRTRAPPLRDSAGAWGSAPSPMSSLTDNFSSATGQVQVHIAPVACDDVILALSRSPAPLLFALSVLVECTLAPSASSRRCVILPPPSVASWAPSPSSLFDAADERRDLTRSAPESGASAAAVVLLEAAVDCSALLKQQEKYCLNPVDSDHESALATALTADIAVQAKVTQIKPETSHRKLESLQCTPMTRINPSWRALTAAPFNYPAHVLYIYGDNRYADSGLTVRHTCIICT